jgi:hypothetical protein
MLEPMARKLTGLRPSRDTEYRIFLIETDSRFWMPEAAVPDEAGRVLFSFCDRGTLYSFLRFVSDLGLMLLVKMCDLIIYLYVCVYIYIELIIP